MNTVQDVILRCAREQSGLWDVVGEIAELCAVSRVEALKRLKAELDFVKSTDEIYLLRSRSLYASEGCEVLSKEELTSIPDDFAEFRKNGPFYYLSNVTNI